MDYQKVLEKYFELPIYVKIGIFAFLWILIAVLIFFLVINPQFTTIKKKEVELAKLQKQTREIIKVTRQIQNFKIELKKLERNFKIALKKLPESKEIPALLLNISEYGRKNHLEFLLFKPGKMTKKDFYGIIPIDIKIRGNFYDIGRFFWELGNMQRIVQLPYINFQPNKQDNSLFVQGRLETYIFLKEKLNAKKNKKKK